MITGTNVIDHCGEDGTLVLISAYYSPLARSHVLCGLHYDAIADTKRDELWHIDVMANQSEGKGIE